MTKFVYACRFRDARLSADDQDHEWPACFCVDAVAGPDASSWGDRIASDYARRRGLQMLTSSIELFETAELPGKHALPAIQFGQAADDDEIGW